MKSPQISVVAIAYNKRGGFAQTAASQQPTTCRSSLEAKVSSARYVIDFGSSIGINVRFS